MEEGIFIEQFGKYVSIKPKWNEETLRKRLEEIKNKRPAFKKEIDGKIQELRHLFEEYNPFDLLAVISIENCFVNPETYSELTHKGKEILIEYALSIALSIDSPKFSNHPPKEVITNLNNQIDEVIYDVIWYFGCETAEGKLNRNLQELRFKSLLGYILLRGPSLPSHHTELIRGIFRPHDSFLKKHFGFGIDEILTGMEDVERQIENNLREEIVFIKSCESMFEKYGKFIERSGLEAFSNVQESFDKFNELEGAGEERNRLLSLQKRLRELPFEIYPSQNAGEELLSLFSCNFGNNRGCFALEKWPGWPTNDSLIYSKPLIKHNGRYFSFGPQILFRNLGNILESWIFSRDGSYYENVYQKKRGAFLEEKTAEYFANILPGAKIATNLYYWVEEDSERKRVESDGIILYDDNVIIVEAKAGSMSISARRGGIETLRKDTEEIIGKAYRQALRTKEYILRQSESHFENENGSPALSLVRNKLRKIFLVNVTLDSLGYISSYLNSVSVFGFIGQEVWPWSVFVNDLRVISELSESPSIFLHYLVSRIRTNDDPHFRAIDELDIFLYYLHDGLDSHQKVAPVDSLVTPLGFTPDLDRYFNYLEGRVKSGKKPQLRIHKEFKSLLRAIESINKEGFTNVTTALLDVITRGQETDILSRLRNKQRKSADTQTSRQLSFYSKSTKKGITFWVAPVFDAENIKQAEKYCKIKRYQTGFKEWFLIFFRQNEQEPIDFIIYAGDLEENPELAEEVQVYKQEVLSKVLQTRKKIGRNEPCPCGSLQKYKKCCGKIRQFAAN